MTPTNQCPSFTHWVNTYIEHFRIAIVDSRGKAPALGKGWQTTASNDPAVVLTQAQDHADCNLGIMPR